jgi:hypothetical protein
LFLSATHENMPSTASVDYMQFQKRITAQKKVETYIKNCCDNATL